MTDVTGILGLRASWEEARPPRGATALRAVAVIALTVAALAPAGLAAALLLAAGRRDAASATLCRRLVAHLQRLGPAYVKFGQIMGTRRDLLPARLCDELGRLHDAVRPMTDRQFRRALAAAYGDDPGRVFAVVEPAPVASGSIAGVYKAVLPDGRDVALKLQRPDIRRRMTRDLSVMCGVSAFAERLPSLRGVPARQLTGFVCAAIFGQLDFGLERENLERLRQNFDGAEYIWVPETVARLCRPTCLAMEFIPGLVTRPLSAIDPARRPVLASRTLSAVYQMLFLDGFVHCDLHPGNVYFSGSKVVILDAGFSIRLPDTVRRLFSEFFLGLALGRGRQCGEVVADSAMHIAPGADVDGFIAAIADLVARFTGVPAKDFHLMRFGTDLFRKQRDFGLYAASEFVFPLLSLLVIEGTVRGLNPEIDFQALARPMLLRAAAEAAHLQGRPR